jgi:alpha-1,6-mannosyltransferase
MRGPVEHEQVPPRLVLCWVGLGAAVFGGAVLLTSASGAFDYARDLEDYPSITFAMAMVCAGLCYAVLLPLLRATDAQKLGQRQSLLFFVALIGIAARLALFPSTPVIEDDWYRYLWDGAVTAHGYNPYAVSPGDAQTDAYATSLQPLAQKSGVIIDRINHSELKTIYPPVAQGAFAVAHVIRPWSLWAWRAVCLLADVITFALILTLLNTVGRSLAWSALYWWNPIVLKELFNSAHSEAIMLPFLTAAIVLAVRRWHVSAAVALGFAAGVKLWPVLLAPLLFRSLLPRKNENNPDASWPKLFMCAAVLGGLCVLWALPPLIGGIDKTSGFLAYAQYWQTNSAHYRPIEAVVRFLVSPFTAERETIALATKSALALAFFFVVLKLAGLVPFGRALQQDDAEPSKVILKAMLAILALLLLSPAQFPWYVTWILPLFAVIPLATPLAMSVLVPVYYAAFHFYAQEDFITYRTTFVWLIWVPVWLALVYDWRRGFAALDKPSRGAHA